MNGEFDPDTITKADMNQLANHIENYVMVLEEVMVIPEDIIESKKNVEEAIKVVRKLIKKLRNGDMDVFKDRDEWNLLD